MPAQSGHGDTEFCRPAGRHLGATRGLPNCTRRPSAPVGTACARRAWFTFGYFLQPFKSIDGEAAFAGWQQCLQPCVMPNRFGQGMRRVPQAGAANFQPYFVNHLALGIWQRGPVPSACQRRAVHLSVEGRRGCVGAMSRSTAIALLNSGRQQISQDFQSFHSCLAWACSS